MISPVQFASNIYNLNGSKLKIPRDTMRHLFPIYNKPSNAMILKFGRQTHKSTTLGYKIPLPCVKYRNYHSLYVAPTGNQVSVFSTDKLDGALRGSPEITDHYFDTKTKDQVSYKEFKNGSKIYLRSAFHSADAIRGISADQTCIDEVQDIISDHIPVIEQCMSHSMAKRKHMVESGINLPAHLFNSRIYAGTPKTVENTMETYWKQSTQCEFIIRCMHQGCKKYNYIDENNVGDTCLICRSCGKPIFYRDGQWVSMNNNGFIDGFRLPQIVLNWINDESDPEAWQVNVIRTRKIYTIEKFYNEILALEYAAAKHPMSLAEVLACCGEYDPIESNMTGNDLVKGNPTFFGIDWGKGDTASGTSYSVLFIGTIYKGKFKIVFVRKYMGRMSDPLLQVEDMLRIIGGFKCSLGIADTGDGRTSNAMMVKALGAKRFAELYEHGTIKQKIKWDKDKGHYIINRTQMMTDLIMEIKRKQISFFRKEKFEQYTPDFTGIYSEYSDQTRMTKYDHNVPDDCFHSYMFCRIAAMIWNGDLSKYLIGGSGME